MRVEERRIAVVVLPLGGAGFVERTFDLFALASLGQAFLSELLQEQHGVLVRLLPLLGVENPEQSLDSWLPCPQQVESKFVEFFHSRNTMVNEGKATT